MGRLLSLVLLMLYLVGFCISGLFHEIEHVHDNEQNQMVSEETHCLHLHNAVNGEVKCDYDAHFSAEHNHCEFCDVFHTKYETLYSQLNGEKNVHHSPSYKRINKTYWKTTLTAQIFLRGPPSLF